MLNILDYIPVGHKNPITRAMLSAKTGLNDRQNRALIEQTWVKEKKAIINDEEGNGYYVVDPNDPKDVRHLMIYIAKTEARVRSLNDKLKVGYEILSEVISDE